MEDYDYTYWFGRISESFPERLPEQQELQIKLFDFFPEQNLFKVIYRYPYFYGQSYYYIGQGNEMRLLSSREETAPRDYTAIVPTQEQI